MRKQLPDHILKRIADLTPYWWGRRAFYEVIEEIGISVYRVYWVLVIAWNLWSWEWIKVDWLTYSVIVGIFVIIAANKATMELIRWNKEIYVVAYNETNGGGKVFKFHGIFKDGVKADAITPTAPVPVEGWRNEIEGSFYKLWGWLTGERMTRVTLQSQNHVYLSGDRVSPQFVLAIERIQGAPKPNQEGEAPLAGLRDLGYAKQVGLLDEYMAGQFAQALARRTING